MIQVLQSGIQTSIQDLGRWGSQSFGIGIGGGMCRYSTSIVNLLVGNKINSPVLEIVQSPHQFLFEKETLVSFSGGGLIPTLNETELPLNQPLFIDAGSLIVLKKPSLGFRLYMAVAGGFQSEEFLNSHSTHFGTKSGGFYGRSIQKGDTLGILENRSEISENLKNSLKKKSFFKINSGSFALKHSNQIRITQGVDFDLLDKESKQIFINKNFSLSNNYNRMGYRLNGDALLLTNPIEKISSAVAMGTIQLLPDGQIIALMADCQTVGGYPKIAHIIETDFPRCAQLKPADEVSFSIISMLEAENLLLSQTKQIQLLEKLIQQNFS